MMKQKELEGVSKWKIQLNAASSWEFAYFKLIAELQYKPNFLGFKDNPEKR